MTAENRPGETGDLGSRPAPPDVFDGFRFARTADGANPDGTPRVSPERGYTTDPAERDRLLGYLAAGAVVVDDNVFGTDRIDPTRHYAVPATFRTDGTWVWPGSVEYYLRWHAISPEPGLRERIAGHGYVCPPVPAAVVGAARQAVFTRDAWLRGRSAQSGPVDDRFPAGVGAMLRTMGWYPGRDLGAQVGSWLAPRAAELAEFPFERDGYPRLAPFPAALAVMREFGGLVSLASGPGQTAARTPVTVYPAEVDLLVDFAESVALLGADIGERVFQVGHVERGMGALVVAESGRMFLAGPVALYAGRDADEALARMLIGIRCEPLP